jgi:hypothetical protein
MPQRYRPAALAGRGTAWTMLDRVLGARLRRGRKCLTGILADGSLIWYVCTREQKDGALERSTRRS